MARISKIFEKNEKILNISRFLPKEIKENEEEFITIRKLTRKEKLKIKLLSTNTMKGQTQKKLLKAMSDKDLSFDNPEDFKKIPKKDLVNIFIDSDLSIEETAKIEKMTVDMEELIINNCVHEEKHSFWEDENKKLKLNYEFFNKLGNEKLIEYIIKQIEIFSKGFDLGEEIGTT